LQKLYPDEHIGVDNDKVIAHSKNAKTLSDILRSNGVELTTVWYNLFQGRELK